MQHLKRINTGAKLQGVCLKFTSVQLFYYNEAMQ